MKCVRCARPLTHVDYWVGKYPIGPKCAEKLGIAKRTEKRVVVQGSKRARKAEIEQMDLFQKEAA